MSARQHLSWSECGCSCSKERQVLGLTALIRASHADPVACQVDKDLREMLIKRDAPPAKKIGVRVWPRAIPQFNLGHQSTVMVS